MSYILDHFRHGSVAVNTSIPLIVGEYFGILVITDGTTFSALTTDVVNSVVLTGITYAGGTYLPIPVSSVKVSAGAILLGRTFRK